MSKRPKTDYLKIIIIGIPLLFIMWALLFILIVWLTRDLGISKYSSIAFTLVLVVLYGYFSIKYAHKIGATIGSLDKFKTPDGRLKCGGCGRESNIEQAFRKIKPGLFRRTILLCPECGSKKYISQSKQSFIIIALFFVVGLLFYYFEPSYYLGSLILNVCLIYFFMLATIIPHEMGHVVTATFLGFKVFRVIIGYGQVLFTRNILGVEWEVRPYPIGGITLIASRGSRAFRLRQFFVFLAGPLVNMFFIILILWLTPRDWAADSFSLLTLTPLFDFILANSIILLVNLWPRKVMTVAGQIENDGLALITMPFSSQKDVKEKLATYYFLAAQEFCLKKQQAQAANKCEEGLKLYPDSILLQTQLGIVLLSMNEFEKARTTFMGILETKDIKPDQRMIILNNIAYTALLADRLDFLEEADRYSEEAYKRIFWIPAVQGTRGAVLVETGRLDEGLALLRKAFDAHAEPEGKALNAAHIAIGEARRGNKEESIRYFNVMRTLNPQCQLLNRVENELKMAGWVEPYEA